MFYQSSGQIAEHVYLLTLGKVCLYALKESDESFTLIDCGPSALFPYLMRRLESLEIPLNRIRKLIVSAPTAERAGACSLLKSAVPDLFIAASGKTIEHLHKLENLSLFLCRDKEILSLYNSNTEAATSPEPHLWNSLEKGSVYSFTLSDCSNSLFYFPNYHFAFAGGCLGFYRGSNLSAPSCSTCLQATGSIVKKARDLPFTLMGLPFEGALSEALARKHLAQLEQTVEDLIREVAEALKDGVSELEIQAHIREQLYVGGTGDPLFEFSLQSTFQEIVRQLRVTPT